MDFMGANTNALGYLFVIVLNMDHLYVKNIHPYVKFLPVYK